MSFDFLNVSVPVQLYNLPYIQVDVIICEWMGYALLYESMLGVLLLCLLMCLLMCC
jgi:hypothetical protein